MYGDTKFPRGCLPFSAFAARGVRGTEPRPQGSQRGSVAASSLHLPLFVHALWKCAWSTAVGWYRELR